MEAGCAKERHNAGFMIPAARCNKHQVRLITHCQQCSSFVRLLLVTISYCEPSHVLWYERQEDDGDIDQQNWVLGIEY